LLAAARHLTGKERAARRPHGWSRAGLLFEMGSCAVGCGVTFN